MSFIHSRRTLCCAVNAGLSFVVLSLWVHSVLGVGGDRRSRVQRGPTDESGKNESTLDDIRRPLAVSLPDWVKKLEVLSTEARSAFAEAFLKGTAKDGRPAQNVVICDSPAHTMGTRNCQEARATNWSPEVAARIALLARVIMNSDGDYATAETLFRRALEIRKSIFGTEHVAVAESLCSLGDLLSHRAQFDMAGSYCHEGLALYHRLPEVSLHDQARCQLWMANVLNAQQRYKEAEPLFRQASATFLKLVGDGHPEVRDIEIDLIAAQNALALLLLDKPDFVEAESLLRMCLTRIRTSSDRMLYQQQEVLTTYNLALLLHNKGDFAEAEDLYREVLQAYERVYGSEHPSIASVLNTLGTLLMRRGDYANAEKCVRRSLQMRIRLLRDDHPAIADSMLRLALVFAARGDFPRAETQFRKAMQKYIQCYGKRHSRVASCLSYLGEMCLRRDDFQAAEVYFREALDMRREIFGGHHPSVAQALANLAHAYVGQGALSKAERSYREALAILEHQRNQILGREDDHASYAGMLELATVSAGLAEVLVRQGRYEAAFEMREIGRNRTLLDLLARSTCNTLTRGDNEHGNHSKVERERVDKSETDRCCRDAKLALAEVRTRSGPQKEVQPTLNVVRREVEGRREELYDAESKSQLRQGSHLRNGEAASLGVIRDALRPGELLLAFSWTNDIVIVFTVPPRGAGEVNASLIAAGQTDVDQLSATVREFRTHISQRPQPGDKETASRLARELKRSLFPKGILSVVQSADRVVAVVDGPLRTIPMELLLMEDAPVAANVAEPSGHGRIPQLTYADSATIFVNRRAQESVSRHKFDSESLSALVVADPLFSTSAIPPPKHGAFITHVVTGGRAEFAGLMRGDIILNYAGQSARDREDLLRLMNGPLPDSLNDPANRIPITFWRTGSVREVFLEPGDPGVQLSRHPAADARRWASLTIRGFRDISTEIVAMDQLRLHGGSLAALPGTRREAQAIAKTIRAAGGSATVLLREEATLAGLEAHVHGKRFVHLATHGLIGSSRYPLEASLALTPPAAQSREDVGFLTLDHLLRTWSGKLDGCELVVLSACDTQHGVVRGDSNITLPWGFMYAGAPSVLASLWRVDDVAVVLLMSRFYENILGEYQQRRAGLLPGTKMSKIRGLSEAKQWLRRLSTSDVIVELAKLGFSVTRDSFGVVGIDSQRAEISDEHPGPSIACGNDRFDFSHPYYWSAFVLIGDPD